ncbi:MAG TPA: hypothetical protein VKM55_06675 [Candidatus Lokiarchaeia archaeon]|nr:hypothetical protein [Candidatus Lokiarchaeia archaeon]
MLNTKNTTREASDRKEAPVEAEKIKVKATLECPSCGYKKTFKNAFSRKQLEQLVVAAKVMSWAACECGDLLAFSLELEL